MILKIAFILFSCTVSVKITFSTRSTVVTQGETSPTSHPWWCSGFTPCPGVPTAPIPSSIPLEPGHYGPGHPSCVQPRLLADSDITTELPKQGLKHFPGKTTSSMPCYGCRLCPLQRVFGANFKCQERVPQSLAQGREPRTNHTAKTPLPWALVVHHEEIKGVGRERGEVCRSQCPPVNPSNSSCGP